MVCPAGSLCRATCVPTAQRGTWVPSLGSPDAHLSGTHSRQFSEETRPIPQTSPQHPPWPSAALLPDSPGMWGTSCTPGTEVTGLRHRVGPVIRELRKLLPQGQEQV